MARVLFFALLAMCLVCLIQGRPDGTQATGEPDNLKKMTDALQQGADALKQLAVNIANDPTVKQITQDVTKAVVSAAETVKNEAEKLVPRTQ